MRFCKTFLAALAVGWGTCAHGVDYYVDATLGSDLNDGSTPTQAKRTLAGAMEIGWIVSGDIVHVAPGVYDEGEMWDGACSNRVVVPAGVGLQSTHGASQTTILGKSDPDGYFGVGDAGLRCVRLGSKAWIQGFTLTGGRTRMTGEGSANGGGAMGGAAADCVFSDNASGGRGTAVYDAICFRCRFEGNPPRRAGNVYVGDFPVYYADCVDCLFLGGDTWYGQGTVINCMFLSGEIRTSSTNCVLRNCYVRYPGERAKFENCLFGCSTNEFPKTAWYDPATCRFDVPAPSATNGYRFAAGSAAVDGGDYARYVKAFPSAYTRFRNLRDLGGGNRLVGRQIDIGPFEIGRTGNPAHAFDGIDMLQLESVDNDAEMLAPGVLSLADGQAATLRWQLSPRVLKDDDFTFTAEVTGNDVLRVYLDGAKTPSWEITSNASPCRVVYRAAGHVLRFRHCGTDGAATIREVRQGVRFVDPANGDDLNDGSTPTLAKRTLAGAMAIEGLKSGDVVHALPGTYAEGAMWLNDCSNRVVVAAGVGLVADGGPTNTFIVGAIDPSNTGGCGPSAIRCVYLQKKAWLSGFTVTGGRTSAINKEHNMFHNRGGGILSQGGAAYGCVVSNNVCHFRGNGAADGYYFSCLFRANSEKLGGSFGVYGASGVFNSVLTDGDVLYSNGCAVNCALIGGRTWGISKIRVYNCYLNQDNGNSIFSNCVFSCASNDLNKLTTTYDPATCRFSVQSCKFDANWRPTYDSPLLDRGSAEIYDRMFPADWAGFKSRDFAGGKRLGGLEIDVGPGELDLESGMSDFGITNSLELVSRDDGVFAMSEKSLVLAGDSSAKVRWTLSPNVLADDDFAFTAEVVGSGSLLVYRDGIATPIASVTAADGAVRVVYAAVGHTLRFVHVGADGYAKVSDLNQGTRFVDPVNGDDANDGFTPESAKRTLAGAMAIQGLKSGDVVHALPGVYDEGETWYSSSSNRVVVPAGVGLLADGCPSNTFIVGAADTSTTNNECGPAAVRCVYLNNGSWLRGFTVTGGRTPTSASTQGGGICSGGAAYGCVISNNACHYRGNGCYGGYYFNCLVRNNGSRKCKGDYGCYAANGVFGSVFTGGDVLYSSGVAVNCTLVGGRTWAPQWIRIYNSYVSNDNGNAAFTNCVLGCASNSLRATTKYDVATCRFSTPGSTLNSDWRPTAKSPMLDAGSAEWYDRLFPAAWSGFKGSDFAGGKRVCGDAIDIGAGEMQVTNAVPPVVAKRRGLMYGIFGRQIMPTLPMALTGSTAEIDAIRFDVTEPMRALVETHSAAAGGLPVDEYCHYSLVAIVGDTTGFSEGALWRTVENCEKVAAYLKSGGMVLVGGLAVNQLAALSDAAWRLIYADDRVMTINLGAYELKRIYSSAGTPLGNADDVGNFILTSAGEHVAAHEEFYATCFGRCESLAYSTEPIEWGVEPLGAAGTLDLPREFANQPVFEDAPPEYGDGIVLYDADQGVKATVVYASASYSGLAGELAWHLGEMSGDAFVSVKGRIPESGPYVYIGNSGTNAGCSVIGPTDDGRGLLLGGQGAGVSHSLTYLLEKLGCRYLWPGATGKVIPRGLTRVVAPAIELYKVPELMGRGMRGTLGTGTNRLDRAGNRSFYAWHGVGDASERSWSRGHYFADYYTRYGADHPDWFALQPNGSRVLNLSDMPERPTLCLSNPDLAAQTASNIVSDLLVSHYNSHSVCLPDGGRTYQCMCRACRALDPVNGDPITLSFNSPYNRTVRYVSLTDRVFTFYNRVCEELVKMLPDAMLGCYAYSVYDTAPAAVTPHPALAVYCVAGSYASDAAIAEHRASLAGWSNSGATALCWRPNALTGIGAAVPEGFARRIFEDLETFKANGYVGTDFDCMYDQWATEGLVYYMLAKAHRNFDRLGYEALLDDYCEKGFGAAAPKMREYYDLIEATYDAAAAQTSSNRYFYVDSLDDVRLETLLDDAATLASDDDEVLARIAFIAKMLPFLRFEKRFSQVWQAERNAPIKQLQAEFRAYLNSTEDDPMVFAHSLFNNSNHFSSMKYPSFGK